MRRHGRPLPQCQADHYCRCARIVEAHFAKACRNAGLELDPGAQPDLIIDQESLFARIAQAGWLGFVESYLAGEWRTPDSAALVKVLTRLLATGYAPRAKVQVPVAPYDGGQIPADLVRLYSDEKTSSFAGIFSTGVATTVRDSMTSYVPAQHGNHEPKHHFIDITTISEPQDVERDDFHDSQARAAQFLLNDLGVTASSHLLEFPANGSVLAEVAGRRRAVVDTLSNDAEHLAALRDDLVLAGVEDFVHTQHISNPLPTPSDWQGRYDAIACMEAFEYLSRTDRVYFLRHAGRLLAPGGKLGLQTLVATDGMTASARNALLALRAYIWPGLIILIPPATTNYSTKNRDCVLLNRPILVRITANRCSCSAAFSKAICGKRRRAASMWSTGVYGYFSWHSARPCWI